MRAFWPLRLVWLGHEPKPPKMKAFWKTATTVTELTGTLSSLTAGTDAPGQCQRRDLATNPRRLCSARLTVNTVTELTDTLSSVPARTDTPGHCHWLDCATNPHPSGRRGTCHYGDWGNRHSKLNNSRHRCSQSLNQNSEMGRPYSTRLASVGSGVRFNFRFTPMSVRRICTSTT
jgi:hypothetical protein